MKSQTEVFLEGEGDAWFNRNAAKSTPEGNRYSTNLMLEALLPFRLNISNIMEIGCGNGSELQKLCAKLDAKGLGIDPSQSAVETGNARAQSMGVDFSLACGSADSLPAEENSQDVVIFGFCLCWVDRRSLLQSLGEADRVLRAGGTLMIVDFDPDFPQKREYAHQSGVFTYKQDYSKVFLATEKYCLVSKQSFSHQGERFEEDANERVALTVLHKSKDRLPLWTGQG
jgi:ubiquinone/menaquinone biosynthesis C-methylase UbiE